MNLSCKIAVVLAAAALPSAVPAAAQTVISAKSGVVSYVEGQVTLDGQTIEPSITRFPDLKENGVLQTTEGRAELLLNPGVILRLGENSSVRMIVNRLIDTRIELVGGSAVVEAMQVAKDTSVTVVVGNAMVGLPSAGIYRFDAQPGQVKVFKGTAEVEIAGKVTPVSSGRQAALEGSETLVARFDADSTDELDRWSRRRGAYMAMANVSSAYSLLGSGYGYNYSLNSAMGCSPAWNLNPWYAMMTYVPCNGYFDSPYGYTFFSPTRLLRSYVTTGTYGWGHGNLGWAGGGFVGASSGPGAIAAAAARSSSPAWGTTRGGIGGFSGGIVGRNEGGFPGGSTGALSSGGAAFPSTGGFSGGSAMGGGGARGSGGGARGK